MFFAKTEEGHKVIAQPASPGRVQLVIEKEQETELVTVKYHMTLREAQDLAYGIENAIRDAE